MPKKSDKRPLGAKAEKTDWKDALKKTERDEPKARKPKKK